MGRGKLEINKSEDARAINSFQTRHAGLLKKAHELSVLCDAEVAVIIFSSTGQLYHFASSSMDQVLSRYNRCLEPSEASKVQPVALKKSSDELAVLKEEVAQLMQRQMKLLGNDLTEYGLNELQQLEQLLNDGLLSLRDRKEQILRHQLEQSRMKGKQIMLENEQLRKQIEESYLQNLPETHGAAFSHDKLYPCFQKKQIMQENKNLQKQFEEIQKYMPTRSQPVQHFLEEKQIMLENDTMEKQVDELQSYFPASEQPLSRFLEHSKEERSSPETHYALCPDVLCKSGAENDGLFTTLLLGTPSGDQHKRKEPEQETFGKESSYRHECKRKEPKQETAEKEFFPGASEQQYDM